MLQGGNLLLFRVLLQIIDFALVQPFLIKNTFLDALQQTRGSRQFVFILSAKEHKHMCVFTV